MATVTYVPLATQTLGSAAASITFSSIPTGYTDLRLVLTATGATAGYYPQVQFNTDTATNYSYTQVYGDGGSGASGSSSNQSSIIPSANGVSTTIPSMYTYDIFQYANTSVYKTSLIIGAEDGNGSGNICATVSLWRSTAAITSIKIFLGTPNLNTGTTATLWGI